jgi:hypothetical protein
MTEAQMKRNVIRIRQEWLAGRASPDVAIMVEYSDRAIMEGRAEAYARGLADAAGAAEMALLRELEIAARGWQQSTQTTARQYRRQMLGILARLDKLRKEPDAG